MRFDDARDRLMHIPRELPSGPSRLDPQVLRSPGEPDPTRPTSSGPLREAAALVLLYPDATGEAHTVLIVRPSGDHVHAGQVALPGGKRERGDVYPEGTALREAAEEIGLRSEAAGVETLGLLETVEIRVSGFVMVPVLAVASSEPTLLADDREVAQLLRVPVRHFLPDATIEMVQEERDGWQLHYGAFPVEGHRVWGATAKVLGQLGALLSAD